MTVDLLAVLGAWTWVDVDPAGRPLAMVLVAPAPEGRPAEAADRMRALAAALGMSGPDAPVADLKRPLAVHPGPSVLLPLDDPHRALRLPAHPRWTRVLLARRRAAVIVGLEPLDGRASSADVDAYLGAALTRQGLLFGHASPLLRSCAPQRINRVEFGHAVDP